MLISLKEKWYWLRHHVYWEAWHRVLSVYLLVLITWGLYRLLFRLPVWFEEVVLKALVFGGPVLYVALKKDGYRLVDLGLRVDRMFSSVYMGLGLGMILGFVGQLGNFLRHGGLQLSSFQLTSQELGGFLLLALVTAFWEELLFMGYLLRKLAVVGNEWTRVGVVASLFALLHVPALVLVQQTSLAQGLVYLLLLFSVGFGNGVLMLRTGNLMAPLLAHAMWGTTVFLFR